MVHESSDAEGHLEECTEFRDEISSLQSRKEVLEAELFRTNALLTTHSESTLEFQAELRLKDGLLFALSKTALTHIRDAERISMTRAAELVEQQLRLSGHRAAGSLQL